MMATSGSAFADDGVEGDKNSEFVSHSSVDTIGDTLAAVEFAVNSQAPSRSDVNEELGAALREMAKGRRDAVQRVWELVADDLYGLALWRTGSVADAEDAVQNVFLRLSSNWAKLARVRNARSYVMRMAHNAAVDASRRRESPMPENPPTLVAIENIDARIDGQKASDLLLELRMIEVELRAARQVRELAD